MSRRLAVEIVLDRYCRDLHHVLRNVNLVSQSHHYTLLVTR